MTRSDKKAETRASILDAAKALFEQEGFDGASIRAIAERAGVAGGTVMLHFDDKKDLLHSTLFEDLRSSVHQTLESLPEHGPLEEQLSHITRGLFAYYEARPTLSPVLLEESLFAEAPWNARFGQQVAQVHGRINNLISKAVDRGEVAPSTNGDRLALAYFSFYYFGLISWVQGMLPDPVAVIDNLVAQHLDGVRP